MSELINHCYPFVLEPLPYGFSAPEPYIDATTMQLHYERHFKGYVDNLNAALEQSPQLQRYSLEGLLQCASRLPCKQSTAILHNAGGVYNHAFYFEGIRPGGGAPCDALSQQIDRAFGSFEAFKSQFTAKALEVFGSGYAWLAANRMGQLQIISTANQNTPLPMIPLICIDVWEHAYYLKHYNQRAQYIIDWFSVADFANAAAVFEAHFSKN